MRRTISRTCVNRPNAEHPRTNACSPPDDFQPHVRPNRERRISVSATQRQRRADRAFSFASSARDNGISTAPREETSDAFTARPGTRAPSHLPRGPAAAFTCICRRARPPSELERGLLARSRASRKSSTNSVARGRRVAVQPHFSTATANAIPPGGVEWTTGNDIKDGGSSK